MTDDDRALRPQFPTPAIIDIPPAAFQQIQDLLLQQRNFHLSHYKDKCVRRRISMRIRAARCTTADDYCRLLLEDERELDRLLRVLTIHVSQFFRNFSMFEKLRREVLPTLFRQVTVRGTGPLRILSLGCASGEEPYSVAMLLRESFSADLERCGATITGIDIDEPTLATARCGVFTEDRLKELTPAAQEHYFTRLNNRFHLADEVRQLVMFRQGDMATDPVPEADLILCRNLLIYLERSQQERLQIAIARALSQDGILVLGKSETLVGVARQYYQALCPVERIYRRPTERKELRPER